MKIDSDEILFLLLIILVCYFFVNWCNKSFEGFIGPCEVLTSQCSNIKTQKQLSYGCCGAIIDQQHARETGDPGKSCDLKGQDELTEKFAEFADYCQIIGDPQFKNCDLDNTAEITYAKKNFKKSDPISNWNLPEYGSWTGCNCVPTHTGNDCGSCIPKDDLYKSLKQMKFDDFMKIPIDDTCLEDLYAVDVHTHSIYLIPFKWIRDNIESIFNGITDWANDNNYPGGKIEEFFKENKESMSEWFPHNPDTTIGIYIAIAGVGGAGVAIRGKILEGLVGWWKDYQVYKGVRDAGWIGVDRMPKKWNDRAFDIKYKRFDPFELEDYKGGVLWRTAWEEGAGFSYSVMSKALLVEMFGGPLGKVIFFATEAVVGTLTSVIGAPVRFARAAATDPVAATTSLARGVFGLGVNIFVITLVQLAVEAIADAERLNNNYELSMDLGLCSPNQDPCDCAIQFDEHGYPLDVVITLSGDSPPPYADIFFEAKVDVPIKFQYGNQTFVTEFDKGLKLEDINLDDGSWSIEYNIGSGVPITMDGSFATWWECE